MKVALLVMVVGLIAAACGEGSTGSAPQLEPPEGIEEARSTVALDVSGVPDGDVESVVAGDTAFALDLVREIYEGGNLILSPLSITTALGMLEAGARGETRAEMAEVLHETLPDERLHPARGALVEAVAAPPSTSTEGDVPPFTLRAVNASWAQTRYPIRDEYLDTLARSYDAGAYLLDFEADPEAARETINAWVERETEDRIVDLVPPGVIDELTRLVLTNAVYFKANWLREFDPKQTADGPFTTAAGSTVTVPMMRLDATLDYVDAGGFAAAWLPYVGDAAMMVLLPEGDLDELLRSLTPQALTDARTKRSERQVALTMPRFEISSPIGLRESLEALGMTAAFVPPPDGADLTGIVAERELYVQDVIHQGFISVDEKGTEAAAATAVVVGVTAAAPPAQLTLDRPFLFAIVHEPSGALLFVGAVTNPHG